MGFLILGIIVFTVFVLTGYFLFQLLANFQPGNNKVSMDLKKIREEMSPWINQLVPWTREEMELLSHNQINKEHKKGIAPTVKGIITSIYNEPMMTYSYKKYVSPNANGILVVRTSNHEFVYRIKAKAIQVMIDNQLVGTIRDGKDFYHVKNNRLLAQIQRKEGELVLPVLIGDKEVGNLKLPENTMKVNNRAFQFLSPMSKEEEALFLSLAAFEMIKSHIKQ